MVIAAVLRQIMADRESLKRYANGELPKFDEVKRRLFLLEREQDHRLPDHFYKRGQEFYLGGLKSLQDLLTTGIHRLASEHLELRRTRIYVKSNAWPKWQDLLGFCSPLVCMCGLLWKEVFRPGTADITELADFMRGYIEPNVWNTCLPSPFFPYMDGMLHDGGLCDLHVHLTGSTETDVAWQDFLKSPFAVYSEIAKAGKNEKVLDQMEQEFACVDAPLQFYHLLCTATRLRYGFVHLLFDGRYTPELEEPFGSLNTPAILTSGSYAERAITPTSEHPMLRVFRTDPHHVAAWSDLSLEGLMYVMVMDRIDATGDANLAAGFHHYLLILGLFNRFLVQQSHQYGFDQFQKITLNEFRTSPEKQYSRRFFQLHGNDSLYLGVLEGRFAPKASVLETMKILNDVIKGWKKFRSNCRKMELRRPHLRLVCHFIKASDKAPLTPASPPPILMIRHRGLRIENMHKARALVMARDGYPRVSKYLTGVDAASNELEAPPEVFAPIYRYLRSNGFKHFTYHVGEDFHHLVGGLRAMYEAVFFLGLDRGDRIGHGTAAGIDPDLWLDHVGEDLPLSQGEWLDDLLFAIYLIEKNPPAGLTAKLPFLRSEAEKLAHNIYQRHFSMYCHTQAWLARRFCPFHLLSDIDEAMRMPTWSPEEWQECDSARQDIEAMVLLDLYHRADCRKRYHEKVMVGVKGFFLPKELRVLQDLLLAELHRREIVLEVLPTSNVRISFYKSHAEHHIWRWLGIGVEEGKVVSTPPIVLGTDDTGIFSTNIFNEYCHVYHHLLHTHKVGYAKAAEVMRALSENARTYAFTAEAGR